MLTVTAVNKSSLAAVSDYWVQVKINDRIIWAGKVTGHTRAKGFPELLRRIANAAASTDTPPLNCGNECPKCACKCGKAPKHSEQDYCGIAGLCWCDACEQWWIAGEPTLLNERPTPKKLKHLPARCVGRRMK